ncbi:hypothetical protein D3C77_635980 [compost metagenome]
MRRLQVVPFLHQLDHAKVLGTLGIQALAVDHRAVLDQPAHVVQLPEDHQVQRIARQLDQLFMETNARLQQHVRRQGVDATGQQVALLLLQSPQHFTITVEAALQQGCRLDQ